MTETIRLTQEDLRLVEEVADKRHHWNRDRGGANTYGLGERVHERDLTLDRDGAAAELAVAKYWDLEWEPIWDRLDKRRPDVGHLHVRSTRVITGSLMIHPDDPDGPFVLAVVLVNDEISLRGWLYSRDAKRKQFWRTDTGRPAFFARQRYLCPLSTCPCAEAEHERKCGCGRTLPATYPWVRCLYCETGQSLKGRHG